MFDGAPVVQRHYDSAGNLVGVTETESPWDEAARAEAEGLYEAELLICPDCGNLREVCSNPDLPWYPQRHICYASKDREAIDRKWRKKHKDAAPDTVGRMPTDGERIWVSTEDLTPDDDFL